MKLGTEVVMYHQLMPQNYEWHPNFPSNDGVAQANNLLKQQIQRYVMTFWKGVFFQADPCEFVAHDKVHLHYNALMWYCWELLIIRRHYLQFHKHGPY